jgi:hypothetical protein
MASHPGLIATIDLLIQRRRRHRKDWTRRVIVGRFATANTFTGNEAVHYRHLQIH